MNLLLQLTCILIIVGALAMPDDYEDFEEQTLPPHLYKRFNEPYTVKIKRNFIQSLHLKCAQKNYFTKFENLETTANMLGECNTLLLETLQLDINTTDNDIKKYCKIIPQCYRNTTTAEPMQKCFNTQERVVLDSIIQSIEKFLCYNDGKIIGQFISDGGNACLRSKNVKVFNCFKDTIRSDGVWPILNVFLDRNCTQLDAIKQCVVNVLRACDKNTTSNIVGSLFEPIQSRICPSAYPENANAKKNFSNEIQSQYSWSGTSGCAVSTGPLLTTLTALFIMCISFMI